MRYIFLGGAGGCLIIEVMIYGLVCLGFVMGWFLVGFFFGFGLVLSSVILL